MNIFQSIVITLISIGLVSSCVEFTKSKNIILNTEEFTISEFTINYANNFDNKINKFHSNVDDFMDHFFVNCFLFIKRNLY
ncbi:hypothetical protein QEJ31_13735 [Pigmentibacter sp. JX0631]|uniref:hypothetical protein n=1 Tax=Pigmentibacter sp. JX0631 TaxID=2976982 RepID=UPI002469872B|nr:hypothetical protein [Pigmentibacter sp. JX0631]WGL59587.1 hypothetical protein QEJ31_13735 [Pigmentibacter sp. JX0631]